MDARSARRRAAGAQIRGLVPEGRDRGSLPCVAFFRYLSAATGRKVHKLRERTGERGRSMIAPTRGMNTRKVHKRRERPGERGRSTVLARRSPLRGKKAERKVHRYRYRRRTGDMYLSARGGRKVPKERHQRAHALWKPVWPLCYCLTEHIHGDVSQYSLRNYLRRRTLRNAAKLNPR